MESMFCYNERTHHKWNYKKEVIVWRQLVSLWEVFLIGRRCNMHAMCQTNSESIMKKTSFRHIVPLMRCSPMPKMHGNEALKQLLQELEELHIYREWSHHKRHYRSLGYLYRAGLYMDLIHFFPLFKCLEVFQQQPFRLANQERRMPVFWQHKSSVQMMLMSPRS